MAGLVETLLSRNSRVMICPRHDVLELTSKLDGRVTSFSRAT